MEKFVRLTSPTSRLDFAMKLVVFLLICGGLNHLRDFLLDGPADRGTFWVNLGDATFTALPMCIFFLLLTGHLNALQKRLYLQANRDWLTGLHNRRWFLENTPEHMLPGDVLLIVDVDHFKTINDSHGHDAGDRCLKEVADHLRSSIRATDRCARIGGEEFALLLYQADLVSIQHIATRISAGFLFEVGDGNTRQVTASVGVAFDLNGQSLKQAFLLADKGVYLAKAEGRARYVMMPADNVQTLHSANA